MNIQIFGKSKCFDTKKAERYFKERRVKYQYIDMKKYGISRGELNGVLRSVPLSDLVDPKHPDAALLRYHDASWINLWCATSAYYHALCGETDKIPEIFSQHRLSDINMLAPGKPMMEMIENQVYLAEGAYAKVAGRSAELLAVCEAMHYALVATHSRIQTAAAYAQLGKIEEAHAWLGKALSNAAPDGLVMPFVENYDILKPLLEREIKNDLISKIIELGEAATARNAAGTRLAAFDVLTPREFEIVELMAQRLSNREIAEKLYLSEGSVKQYVNRIYSKLHIEGDTRTKRKALAGLFGQKT